MRGIFLGWWVLLCSLSYSTWGQARLNLDFEPTANASQPFLLWFHYLNPDCDIDLDTLGAQHGRGSVRFTIAQEAETTYSHLGNLSLPVDSARGKLLTLSAYVRTTNFRGQAGLYAIVAAPETAEHLAIGDKLDSLPRNSSWRRVQMQVPVGQVARGLAIGFKVQGTGQIWLDNVQVQFDKHPYQDVPLAGTDPLLQPRTTPADWGFESFLPLAPALASAAYQASLDPLAPHGGRSSLRVDVTTAGNSVYPLLGELHLDSAMWGKKLTITGYFRQASSTSSTPAFYYAELWLDKRHRLPYADRRQFHAVPLPPASPTWQPFEVSLVVPTPGVTDSPQVQEELTLGLALTGPTTLWLDDMQFTLNKQPFTPRSPVALSSPTAAEVAWLRQASHPLLSTAPTAPFTDLAVFGTLVGPSNLVGLGGVTYGSQEIQLVQQRLFRYLVDQKGFTGLLLEADMAACYRLNQYLLTGQGDLQRLLAELGPWNTQPMLTLLQWLRAYNQRAGKQVQLMGTAMTNPAGILHTLRQATAATDTPMLAQLAELEKLLTELEATQLHNNPYAATYRKPALLQQVHALVEALRTTPLRYRSTTLVQLAWRDQWLRLLEHYSTWSTLRFDVAQDYQLGVQAENITWLVRQLPSHKAALLGHNTFISNESGVGHWLKQVEGIGYVTLGITFGKGNFTVYQEGVPELVTAQPAYPGTYEAYFQAAHLPLALLNLRAVTLQAATTGWLFQRLLLRDVQLQDTRDNFNRYDIRREFEGLLFLDTSSATLRVPKK